MTHAGLRHFVPGPRQQIFLLEEGVFASGTGPGRGTHRVGSVPDYAHAASGLKRGSAACHPDVLGAAGTYLSQMDELQFCLAELLPYLKDSSAPRASESSGLERLARLARELRTALDECLGPEPYTEALAESLGVPCALVERAAIPIEPVGRPRRRDLCVELNGQRYRYALDRTESLHDFVRRTGVALRAQLRNTVAADPALNVRITEFTGALRGVLRRYRPEKRANYSLFHHDEHHQLQYCGGSWMLVRGPLEMRIGTGTVFTALHIRGRTRRQRQSVSPAVGGSESSFWSASGRAIASRTCMGTPEQYSRLLSESFSDAEALVQWLDAGAILATRRPDFHRQWREARKTEVVF